ncbi:unnamed protein product, partial [Effrenium voratum]
GQGALCRSPLHVASQGSEKGALIKLLQDHPESDPCVADANGWTSLHVACAWGKAAELRILLTQARLLHPQLLPYSDGKENQPMKGREQDRVSGIEKRPVSQPPSWCAVGFRQEPGFPKKVGMKGPRDFEAAGYPSHCWTTDLAEVSTSLSSLMGRTPTHLAAQSAGEQEEDVWSCSNGHIQCLDALLEMGFLDLDKADDRGMSPLLGACLAGSLAGVVWLLLHGADCYAQDKMKRNALHVASSLGPSAGRIVKFLCRWDADVSRLKGGRDWKGRRPQEVYLYRQGWCRRNNPGGDERLEQFATLWEAARLGDLNLLRLSLKANAAIDEASPGGWTPAMYAAHGGHIEVLRILLAMRCSCAAVEGKPQRPELKKWHGDTPLHVAAEAGRPDICSLLVRAGGASLQARNHAGRSPLHSSAAAGQLKTLKMLLALKADPEETEKSEVPRNVFHMLADKDLCCTQWLLDFMLAEDGGAPKVVRLLEHEEQ